MFPLGTVIFPGGLLPLHVFEERYRALVADCLSGDGRFGVVLIERGSEVGGGDQRASVGTETRIEAARPFDDGRWAMIARATQRVEVVEWLTDHPYPCALVRDLPDDDPGAEAGVDAETLERAGAAVRRVRTLASELGRDLPHDDVELDDEPAAPDTLDLWRLCARAPFTTFDRQRLLVAPGASAPGPPCWSSWPRRWPTTWPRCCDDGARPPKRPWAVPLR